MVVKLVRRRGVSLLGMAASCLSLILLLASGVTAAPISADDEDVEVIVVANAGK